MEWNRLVPELTVSNYEQAKAFYLNVFGFRLCFERAEDRFGYFDLGGAQLMLLEHSGAAAGSLGGKGMHFQVELDSIDDLLTRLEGAAVELTTPVTESWYRVDDLEHGQREFFVADPDGYSFRFFEYLGERAAFPPR